MPSYNTEQGMFIHFDPSPGIDLLLYTEGFDVVFDRNGLLIKDRTRKLHDKQIRPEEKIPENSTKDILMEVLSSINTDFIDTGSALIGAATAIKILNKEKS